jgi:hypothetical protein
MVANETIYRGQSLVSADESIQLTLQGDGNLVLSHVNGAAIWSSGTAGQPAISLTMQLDGNLVLKGPRQETIWATGTTGYDAYVVVQNDRNLVVYETALHSALWASNTASDTARLVVPGFLPSTIAPLFPNGPWPHLTTLQIPGLPPLPVNGRQWGLCGGMSFIARDIYACRGQQQLRNSRSEDVPESVVDHIVQRLLDSYANPLVVKMWLDADSMPDHDTWTGPGLFRVTFNGLSYIRSEIHAGRPVVIGVVLTQSSNPIDAFDNHQVLVWGLDQNGDALTLRTYDCNYPGRDDIYIRLDASAPTPAKTIETNGTDNPSHPGTIRGFFPIPYGLSSPAPLFVDDARVELVTMPPQQGPPGATTPVSVRVHNTGSTTWEQIGEVNNYALVSVGDSWISSGFTELNFAAETRLDPGNSYDFTFEAESPTTPGYYRFAWQVRRAGTFGTPGSAVIEVGKIGKETKDHEKPHDKPAQDKLAAIDKIAAAEHQRATQTGADADAPLSFTPAYQLELSGAPWASGADRADGRQAFIRPDERPDVG